MSERPDLLHWFDVPDQAAWEAEALRVLRGKPLAALTSRLSSGLGLPGLFTALPEGVDPGAADAAPYTRGAGGADRRVAGWDLRVWTDAPEVEVAAHRLADDVGQGARSVWVVPDGHSTGQVGAGVAVRTLTDLLDLLGGVRLFDHPICIEAGEHGLGWLAALVTAAAEVGVTGANLTGQVAMDPLGTLATSGTLAHGVDAAFDELAEAIGWAEAHAPSLQLVSLSSVPVAVAGGHRVQQLAWLLAAGAETFRQLVRRGVDPARVAAVSSLRLATGRETFADLAMIRAARTVWSKLLAAWGLPAASQRSFVHAVVGEATFTGRDPWVNVLRGTAEGFAAAVGGADAITLLPYDVRLGQTSDAAHRLARTTQLALAEESDLARVMDPAGGAWSVETLTDQLGRAAWALLQQVEAQGGLAAALQSGWWQAQVAEAAEARDARVASRKVPILGVSVQPNPTEALPACAARVPVPPVAPAELPSGDRWAAAVGLLSQGAAIGAVGAALRVKGARASVSPLPLRLASAPWEALRDRVEAAETPPSVLLVGLGPLAAHTGRADWVRQVFDAAGLSVTVLRSPADVAEVLAALPEGAGVCFAGTDAAYAEALPAWAEALSEAAFVALAGKGADGDGISHHLFLGADLLAAATDLLDRTLGDA